MRLNLYACLARVVDAVFEAGGGPLGEGGAEIGARLLVRDERRLVDLRYEADLANPAIAQVLGLPEGTVKVRLHRIRNRLRILMAEPL